MTDAVERLSSALSGRYLLEPELGQGGMATVYLAQDFKYDRQVALKVHRPEVAAGRFLAETKTTANLQHPHILAHHSLRDAQSADGPAEAPAPMTDTLAVLRSATSWPRSSPPCDAAVIPRIAFPDPRTAS